MLIPYIINLVGHILKDMSKKSKRFNQDLEVINNYMEKKDLSVKKIINFKSNFSFFFNKNLNI